MAGGSAARQSGCWRATSSRFLGQTPLATAATQVLGACAVVDVQLHRGVGLWQLDLFRHKVGPRGHLVLLRKVRALAVEQLDDGALSHPGIPSLEFGA